ncbi:hypothetical protein NF867_16945 [Solitalea sp. MAHUQ-68]|uniref:Uncharacterized protein n=1 Tax=Solitalea agri TaxID=2953739 RepID=A0A9X2F4G6_9SPHI|nr:hypothetical protein [Solitalea agri]MCO4294552.1 hypothetical protein [Solitalea agri]
MATVAVCLTYIGCSSQRGENKSNTSDSTNYDNSGVKTDSIPPVDTTKRDTSRKDSI